MDKRLEQPLARLETVLRAQAAVQDQMLATLKRKREALASADRAALSETCEQENQQVQALAELEKRRLEMVAELTLLVDAAAAPMRLQELAERLPEPARGRLLVLRQELRQKIETVRREAGVARRTAESLVKHMHGLMQTIGSAVTGVGTYGRGGALPRAASAVSTFNLTA